MKKKSNRKDTIDDIKRKIESLNGRINAANIRNDKIKRSKPRGITDIVINQHTIDRNDRIIAKNQHDVEVLREAAHILAGRTYKVDF